MVRTRHQDHQRAQDGIPPTPPQELPTTSRPKRATRQTSRSQSAEPIPLPTSTATRATPLARQGGNVTKKRKAAKQPTESLGRAKKTSRIIRPAGAEHPTKSIPTKPVSIAEEPEAEIAAHEHEDAMETEEHEGISISSSSPLSSPPSSPEQAMVPQDAVPARRESNTCRLFRELNGDIEPSNVAAGQDDGDVAMQDAPKGGVPVPPAAAPASIPGPARAPKTSTSGFAVSPPARLFWPTAAPRSRLFGGRYVPFSLTKLPDTYDKDGDRVSQKYLQVALPASMTYDICATIARHPDVYGTELPQLIDQQLNVDIPGYERVPQMFDEAGNRLSGVTKLVKLYDTESEEEDENEDRMNTRETLDPQSPTTLQPPFIQAAEEKHNGLLETPKAKSFGITSIIPATVYKAFSIFGRKPASTPQQTNEHATHAVTEPRPQHVSATQGLPPRSSHKQAQIASTSKSGRSADAVHRNLGLHHTTRLPLSEARNRERGLLSLWRAEQQEARRHMKKTKRQQLEERARRLEAQNAKLEEEKALQEKELLEWRIEKDRRRRGGTETNPWNMRRPWEKKAQQQAEQQAAPQTSQQNMRRTTPETPVLTLAERRKRKREHSPEVLYPPDGATYGIRLEDITYGTSDEDTESEEEDNATSNPPSSKRRQTKSPRNETFVDPFNASPHVTLPGDRTSTEVIGDPSRATPYEGTRFASPETPQPQKRNLFKQASVKSVSGSESTSERSSRSSPFNPPDTPYFNNNPAGTFRVPDTPSTTSTQSNTSFNPSQTPRLGNNSSGTFSVPETPSDDESDDESTTEVPTPTQRTSGQAAQPSSLTSSKPLADQTQPSLPVEQPTPWDSTRDMTRPEISAMKQREQLLKYAPKTPSRLYQSSRLSNSTIVSDREDDDFTVTPRANRQQAASTTQNAPSQAAAASTSSTADYDPSQPAAGLAAAEITAYKPSDSITQSKSTFDGKSFGSNASASTTPATTFGEPQTSSEPYNAYGEYMATVSPNVANFISTKWRNPEDEFDSVTLFERGISAFEKAQNAATTPPPATTQSTPIFTPRVQQFLDQTFTSAHKSEAAAKFASEFAAFEAAHA